MILKNNSSNNDSFINRLKSCLIVQAKYKEAFRALRDSLGGNQALNGFQVNSTSSFEMVANNSTNTFKEVSQSPLNKSLNPRQIMTLNTRRMSADTGNSSAARLVGILMSDEEAIFGHMDSFCDRVRSVLEEIVSLAQFQTLYKQAGSLPRPKRDDFAKGTLINGRFVTNKNGDENSDDDDDEVEGHGKDASDNEASDADLGASSSEIFSKSKGSSSDKSTQRRAGKPTKRTKKAGKSIKGSESNRESDKEEEEILGNFTLCFSYLETF
jgi:hypothetical protein